MRWWFRASLPTPALLGYVVAVGAILLLGDVKVPYPTLGGTIAVSSLSTLIAFLPPTIWIRVRVRAQSDFIGGAIRTRIPLLDMALLGIAPLSVAIAAVSGVLGARSALVPLLVYSVLAIVAAAPISPREFRVLPAAALAIGMLAGHEDDDHPRWWALVLVEVPFGTESMVATALLLVAGAVYHLSLVFRAR